MPHVNVVVDWRHVLLMQQQSRVCHSRRDFIGSPDYDELKRKMSNNKSTSDTAEAVAPTPAEPTAATEEKFPCNYCSQIFTSRKEVMLENAKFVFVMLKREKQTFAEGNLKPAAGLFSKLFILDRDILVSFSHICAFEVAFSQTSIHFVRKGNMSGSTRSFKPSAAVSVLREA